MNKKIKAGIIGGAGYTGGELIRLLLNHPQVEIDFVHSRSQAGKQVSETHPDLTGETELNFTDKINPKADVLFLCLGHGESAKWLSENKSTNAKIIDLSQDFRLQKNGNDFIYGLPEFQKGKIQSAHFIANPGCFATAIQLALLPLAFSKKLKSDIQISATTGSTGAGQSLSATSHFSWRFGNHSAYKTLEHQHLAEIAQTIHELDANFKNEIHFVPQRGNFTRGIHAVLHTETEINEAEAVELFSSFYAAHPFVHILKSAIDLKQVVNTNKCFIQVQVIGKRIAVTSAIDNLLKGASGQAVQNMNLTFGFEETCGLKLKPSAY